MNKYGARKVQVGDKILDSVHEGRRYQELLLRQRAGEIQSLETQVKFLLIPAQYETYERYSDKTGKRLKDGQRCLEQKVEYIADFVYQNMETGEWIVEDAKGCTTPEYVIKRKLMLAIHGIRVKEYREEKRPKALNRKGGKR